ncbi:tetratricopeptide repeat protein [Kitasatospora sp. NBC_00240]|uniref:tetratricopeptide repeat protein n=1 Tax=Kitasatospora sp. NBC_00240 TaxID=2903567 RepID=UPI00225B0C4E|nr:tetratricopeptide repeat protein [Kitasatospora sp. NBC_00240]MCX5209064.1 tetratricopeptide repeat protein [Kitasatospora sp. NBC_00240]
MTTGTRSKTLEPIMATDGTTRATDGPARAPNGTRLAGPASEQRADYEPARPAGAVLRGATLADQGDYAGAEAVLRRAIRLGEAAHGPDDPRLAPPLRALAAIRAARGGLAEAQALSLRVLALVEDGARWQEHERRSEQS